MDVVFNDNSDEVLASYREQLDTGLEAVGLSIESWAKDNLTASGTVDTGRLRNSITYTTITRSGQTIRYRTDSQGNVASETQLDVQTTEENKVVVGTAVSYAPYVENGTGIYASNGRRTPWRYRAYDRRIGAYRYFTTRGMRPTHFLRNAITQHTAVIRNMLIHYLRDSE